MFSASRAPCARRTVEIGKLLIRCWSTSDRRESLSYRIITILWPSHTVLIESIATTDQLAKYVEDQMVEQTVFTFLSSFSLLDWLFSFLQQHLCTSIIIYFEVACMPLGLHKPQCYAMLSTHRISAWRLFECSRVVSFFGKIIASIRWKKNIWLISNNMRSSTVRLCREIKPPDQPYQPTKKKLTSSSAILEMHARHFYAALLSHNLRSVN